jgi:adenosylcobinamide kinase / adenosylcobinamide-phosphate guanylyltransferase
MIPMATITLITGGARSGKSTQALKLAVPHKRKFFVATGQALDEEMTARIEFHRETRPSEFQTVEEAVLVVPALERLAERADFVVLDCLTLWVSNLMQLYTQDQPILTAADQLAKILKASPFASVVVTDEVGWGIVPEHPIARRYRDLLGWTNQKIASVADDVLLTVSGYPIKVK